MACTWIVFWGVPIGRILMPSLADNILLSIAQSMPLQMEICCCKAWLVARIYLSTRSRVCLSLSLSTLEGFCVCVWYYPRSSCVTWTCFLSQKLCLPFVVNYWQWLKKGNEEKRHSKLLRQQCRARHNLLPSWSDYKITTRCTWLFEQSTVWFLVHPFSLSLSLMSFSGMWLKTIEHQRIFPKK